MAEEKQGDDVEKFLQEEQSLEGRKQALIDDLLRRRAEAMQSFDDKLAKLGYKANSRPKRSHHKKPEAEHPSPKSKAKA